MLVLTAALSHTLNPWQQQLLELGVPYEQLIASRISWKDFGNSVVKTVKHASHEPPADKFLHCEKRIFEELEKFHHPTSEQEKRVSYQKKAYELGLPLNSILFAKHSWEEAGEETVLFLQECKNKQKDFARGFLDIEGLTSAQITLIRSGFSRYDVTNTGTFDWKQKGTLLASSLKELPENERYGAFAAALERDDMAIREGRTDSFTRRHLPPSNHISMLRKRNMQGRNIGLG